MWKIFFFKEHNTRQMHAVGFKPGAPCLLATGLWPLSFILNIQTKTNLHSFYSPWRPLVKSWNGMLKIHRSSEPLEQRKCLNFTASFKRSTRLKHSNDTQDHIKPNNQSFWPPVFCHIVIDWDWNKKWMLRNILHGKYRMQEFKCAFY